MNREGVHAAMLWRGCLQAGDVMAHYGLGYTLYDLGYHREAYRHLRAYTEFVPTDAWAWCWTGKAAHAIGDRHDAQRCYRRALGLEQATGEATSAEALLEALHAGLPPEVVHEDDDEDDYEEDYEDEDDADEDDED